MHKVTILMADDWESLFIDGKLSYQGHGVRPEHVLKALDIDFNCREIDDYEALDAHGQFGSSLEQCRQQGIIKDDNSSNTDA